MFEVKKINKLYLYWIYYILLHLFANNQVILENIISFIFVREFIITKEINFFFDK
jgi:hypothetical protein